MLVWVQRCGLSHPAHISSMVRDLAKKKKKPGSNPRVPWGEPDLVPQFLSEQVSTCMLLRNQASVHFTNAKIKIQNGFVPCSRWHRFVVELVLEFRPSFFFMFF